MDIPSNRFRLRDSNDLFRIPLGTAYAIWTGIGAVGTVLIGILVFKEDVSPLRLLFVSMIIVSLIGLKLVSH